ncbi:MAG TPA: M23 family metallopeptidase [Aeromicrobium sp.]|nr:M23 family metallopeptidase [Aeromicrobium sp.]
MQAIRMLAAAALVLPLAMPSPASAQPMRAAKTAVAPAPHHASFRLPVGQYRLTGRFGDVSGLWRREHTGLDFAAPTGTPIHAISAGTITAASYDGAYGNKTVLHLDDGTDLWFCHQTRFAVSAGERVAAGELIGYVGRTGNATGDHVHIEVHPDGGDPVDPQVWLAKRGLLA